MVGIIAALALTGACTGSTTDAGGSDATNERSSGDAGDTENEPAESSTRNSADQDADGDTTTTLGAGGQGSTTAVDSGAEPTTSTEDGGTEEDSSTTVADTEAEVRPDGIELLFTDGALGPAQLGATIDQIRAALGPDYSIEPEASIRVDFPEGYSVSRNGEVLFWAIEDDGRITVFMTNSPKVGLDSGLRPKLGLADAIELHGEPTLSLGPEIREFVSFEDGTGSGRPLSILVAVGEFGGPVGSYQTFDIGEEADGYTLEDANIKELWFWADDA